MKWYAISLSGGKNDLDCVCPGVDPSEAMSLARIDCGVKQDYPNVSCMELREDEAAAINDKAKGYMDEHKKENENAPVLDNATDARCVYECLKAAGVLPRDLAMDLAKFRNPDAESLAQTDVARPDAGAVAANALDGGKPMLVDQASDLQPAGLADANNEGAAALADAKADAAAGSKAEEEKMDDLKTADKGQSNKQSKHRK